MSLVKKSVLTGLVKAVNIILSFIVQFLLTPFILAMLGKELFGVYSIVNKMQGYISMVDLRPTAILRYKLSALQNSRDVSLKNEYVSASFLTSLMLLPCMVLLGWVLGEVFENYFIVNQRYVEEGRIAIVLLSVFIAVKGILGIPEAIIRGNNAEYKIFYIEPLRLIIYSIILVVVLKFNTGLIGVVFTVIVTGIMDFGFKYFYAKRNFKAYKLSFQGKSKMKEFIGKGSFYMLSSFASQLLNSFDIIILGSFIGVKLVATYSLSKSMMFRVFESISSVLGGMTASVGQLIGDGDVDKLKDLRRQLWRYNLIIGIGLFLYFLYFNDSFVGLWVGKENYIGYYVNQLLVFTAFLSFLILVDEIFINSYEEFKKKSIIVIVSSSIFVLVSIVFIKTYSVYAVVIGLLIAKSIQIVGYEIVLQKKIKLSSKLFLKDNFKILIVLLTFVFINSIRGNFIVDNWWRYLGLSFLFGLGYLSIVILFVLNNNEKLKFFSLIKRIKL